MAQIGSYAMTTFAACSGVKSFEADADLLRHELLGFAFLKVSRDSPQQYTGVMPDAKRALIFKIAGLGGLAIVGAALTVAQDAPIDAESFKHRDRDFAREGAMIVLIAVLGRDDAFRIDVFFDGVEANEGRGDAHIDAVGSRRNRPSPGG
jgi:hypothetical protein